MSSGPEHYRKAEDLAEQALAALTSDDSRISGQGRQMAHDMLISRAQVHATLALAAATASESSGSAYHVDPRWTEVLR
jgi:hypothetical protein